MDPRVGYVKREILISGTDDWVNVAEIAGFAREAVYGDQVQEGYPSDSSLSVEDLAAARDQWLAKQEREVFPLGIAAVKELLDEGLVRVGYTANREFVPWEETGKVLTSRLDETVEHAQFRLLPGDLFWLEITDRGNQAAEQFGSASQ